MPLAYGDRLAVGWSRRCGAEHGLASGKAQRLRFSIGGKLAKAARHFFLTWEVPSCHHLTRSACWEKKTVTPRALGHAGQLVLGPHHAARLTL